MTSPEGNPDDRTQGWPASGQPPPYSGQTAYSPPGYPAYPGYPPPGYPPPPRQTNGLAIASLILGILWLYWVGSVLALIFGYVARSQIRERGEGGAGLATAGIVLGWIGIAVLVAIFAFFIIAGIAESSY